MRAATYNAENCVVWRRGLGLEPILLFFPPFFFLSSNSFFFFFTHFAQYFAHYLAIFLLEYLDLLAVFPET